MNASSPITIKARLLHGALNSEAGG